MYVYIYMYIYIESSHSHLDKLLQLCYCAITLEVFSSSVTLFHTLLILF